MKSTAGSSLLEMVIVLAMLGGVAGTMGLVSKTSTSAVSTTRTVAKTEERSRQTTSTVIELLRFCGRDSLTPRLDLPLFARDAEFVRSQGAEAGVQLWGPSERLELQEDPADPDNGLDDDNDGMIDERILVHIINPGLFNEQSVIISRNIAEFLEGELENGVDDNGNGMTDEPGFCLSYDGFLLTLHLTVIDVTQDGIPIVTTSTRSLALSLPGP